MSTNPGESPAPAEPVIAFLERAVQLALANIGPGREPFGALVVRDGRVLGDGVNTGVLDADPTAHAEVAAIRAACRTLGTPTLTGATVVSSCEPCPMCTVVAVLAGVERVVYAAPKETAAAAGFVLPVPAAEAGERMRDAARGFVVHVPTAGAEEPFERYRAWLATAEASAAPPSRGAPVTELRLALTVDDYDRAVAFYRGSLGLPLVMDWATERGRGTVLGAGRATLELISTDQAQFIDEVEVGRRVAGPVRVALEVEDSAGTADRLVGAGAERLGEPVVTPWNDRNVRIVAPDGMQLTLFTVLSENETEA